MKFTGLQKAKFVSRINRFLGVVLLEGVKIETFIPNPGRMEELLHPGATVWIANKKALHRKTVFDLVLVEHNDTLVSIDSRTPNTVLAEAILAGTAPEFKGYTIERREPSYDDSRFDLLLTDGHRKLTLEVKSCTLIEDGIALFPDAPTKRGTRHLKTLIKALHEGRSTILFLIQRSDAKTFQPNKKTDPEFTKALHEAAKKGVEVYAYGSNVTINEISLKGRIPIDLGEP
jgi:sugar fermentation stimulation protein A